MIGLILEYGEHYILYFFYWLEFSLSVLLFVVNNKSAIVNSSIIYLFYNQVSLQVFDRGLRAIPLSVDLWLHYLTYQKATYGDDTGRIREQFERALSACGLEFRSDRLWEGYIKWELEEKNYRKVMEIYDRLLATPTFGYMSHFDRFLY